MNLLKNIVKSGFTFGFIVGLLYLMMQCDYFPLDFLTPNDFKLDSSTHEFDVKTKQGTWINALSVNGSREQYLGLPYNIDKDTVIYYNDYSVLYNKQKETVDIVEIIGEWFDIKRLDGYTTRISIDENSNIAERNIQIQIVTETVTRYITINQKGKD